jgi:AmmeMemoRadiSam system protein B
MDAGPVRQPAMAGRFYEGHSDALLREIEACYTGTLGPGRLPQVNPEGARDILGIVSPHAGYMFSGPTAAHAFLQLADDGIPEVAVIISPTHVTGIQAIQTEGAWRTPLGDVPIHHELANAVASRLPNFEDGVSGFVGEHTLEVQLPFLQHLYGDRCPIIPIMVVRQDMAEAVAVADAISGACAGRNVVIIASTDMTHYTRPEVAIEQDRLLIPLMESLDAEAILRTRPDITMCGRGAVAAMMLAARRLGATTGKLAHYSHSGETMPSDSVVGYASVVVRK